MHVPPDSCSGEQKPSSAAHAALGKQSAAQHAHQRSLSTMGENAQSPLQLSGAGVGGAGVTGSVGCAGRQNHAVRVALRLLTCGGRPHSSVSTAQSTTRVPRRACVWYCSVRWSSSPHA